jgi:hypothetical protein
MENIGMKREGNKLIITIDLEDTVGETKGGKGEVIAQSHGYVPIRSATLAFTCGVPSRKLRSPTVA